MERLLWLSVCLLLPACASPETSRPPALTNTPPPAAILTPTDTPTPTLTPFTLGCTIQATRTPPPGAPTYIPGGPSPHEPGDVVDPHVEVCLTDTAMRIGDIVRVYAQAVDVGLPIYYFTATDLISEDARLEVRVTPKIVDGQGEIFVEVDTSQVLEFLEVEENGWDMIFVLRARGPGEAEISIRASGEVHYGYPGPAAWEGGESDSFTVSVTGSQGKGADTYKEEWVMRGGMGDNSPAVGLRAG